LTIYSFYSQAQRNIGHLILYFTILPCFIQQCKHNGIPLRTKGMFRTQHFQFIVDLMMVAWRPKHVV